MDSGGGGDGKEIASYYCSLDGCALCSNIYCGVFESEDNNAKGLSSNDNDVYSTPYSS